MKESLIMSGLIRVHKKGKSAIPPLLNSPEVLSSVSKKGKFLAETFPVTLILMT